MAVLRLARRLIEPAQTPTGVEIGRTPALNEDLLDIVAPKNLGERTEFGNRPEHSVHHVSRVVKGAALAEMCPRLVLIDRTADEGQNPIPVGDGIDPP
jgi:hypothetical protein